MNIERNCGFDCPHCGHHLYFDAEKIPRVLFCDHCMTSVKVPEYVAQYAVGFCVTSQPYCTH